ncbi:MAG: hypothetical protein GX575_28355 [Candidatus Anammoximicrobium sp.]|nr:hypothetical protein [Candidatus Anammoximicrobium sp.]
MTNQTPNCGESLPQRRGSAPAIDPTADRTTLAILVIGIMIQIAVVLLGAYR